MPIPRRYRSATQTNDIRFQMLGIEVLRNVLVRCIGHHDFILIGLQHLIAEHEVGGAIVLSLRVPGWRRTSTVGFLPR